VRDHLILHNPCAGTDLPPEHKRRVTIYQPDEWERLFAAIPAWWRGMAATSIECGWRWGELLGLQVDDFVPAATGRPGVLTARRTIIEPGTKYTGNGTRFAVKPRLKSGRAQAVEERALGVSNELSSLIETMIEERRLIPGDRLFSMPQRIEGRLIVKRTDEWPHGVPVSRSYFRQSVWLVAIGEAQVPQRRFHDVRSSNISWLLAGGADVATAMERAGHTQIRTTKLYTTALADSQARALAALDRVRRRTDDEGQ
jgi:integrase